jgi:hypothetical protein
MQIYDYDGNATFDGVWTTITASKSFNSNLLYIPKDATHWVRYTTGAVAAISNGERLTGGTSAKTCTLVAVVSEIGTAGDGDTGILLVKNPSGAFQAETLTGGTSTGTVAIIQDFIELRPGLVSPKAMLITAESATLAVTLTGTTPTVAGGSNHGVSMAAGTSWHIRGINNIKNFKAINSVNANGSVMKYILFF